jgi:hypothetical protein
MATEKYRQQPKANEISATGDTASLSKTETTQVLQKTIEQLETILEQLKTEEVQDLPTKTSLDTLVTITEELATKIAQCLEQTEISTEQIAIQSNMPPENPREIAEEKTSSLTSPSIESKTEKEAISEEKIKAKTITQSKTWWNQILNTIRSQWLLASVVVVSLVVFIAINYLKILPEKTTPIEIADNLPTAEEPINFPETTFPLIQEEPSSSRKELVDLEKNTSLPIEEKITTPSELVASGKSKPVKVENAPTKIKLTPEQNTIQTQVAEIAAQYPEELVLSIETNFRRSYLLVKVSDDWYELNQSRQNKLASDMYKRSQQLNFHKLEIVDLEGTLVARNPVVGNEMVIFQREKDNQES